MMTVLFGLMLSAPPTSVAPTPAEMIASELGVPPLAEWTGTLPKAYDADAVTAEAMRADPKTYAVRLAVQAAAAEMAASHKLKIRREVYEPKLDAFKKEILEFQEDLATSILRLKESQEAIAKVMPLRKTEPSARWQAHADYLHHATLLRATWLEEVNLSYGVLHRNDQPKLDEKQQQTGWLMEADAKLKSKGEVREMAAAAREGLEAVVKAHAGTPWAKLAERDLAQEPGLKWTAAAVKPPAPPMKPDLKKKK